MYIKQYLASFSKKWIAFWPRQSLCECHAWHCHKGAQSENTLGPGSYMVTRWALEHWKAHHRISRGAWWFHYCHHPSQSYSPQTKCTPSFMHTKSMLPFFLSFFYCCDENIDYHRWNPPLSKVIQIDLTTHACQAAHNKCCVTYLTYKWPST